MNAQHNKARELVGGQKFKCSICPLLWPLKYLHTIYQFKFSFHKYRNLSRSMEARRRYRNTLYIQTTNKNRDSSQIYGLHKGHSLIDSSAVAASFKKKKKLHLCCQTDDGVFLICLFCLFTQVVVC